MGNWGTGMYVTDLFVILTGVNLLCFCHTDPGQISLYHGDELTPGTSSQEAKCPRWKNCQSRQTADFGRRQGFIKRLLQAQRNAGSSTFFHTFFLYTNDLYILMRLVGLSLNIRQSCLPGGEVDFSDKSYLSITFIQNHLQWITERKLWTFEILDIYAWVHHTCHGGELHLENNHT